MKTATSTLRTEHQAILQMLDATEEAARRLARGESVEPKILAGLLEFFRIFADRCHHGKEERLLFPFLEQKGMPRNGGPIGVMLLEHDQGRELIRRMQEGAEEYAGGHEGGAQRWAGAAIQYATLLRDHIRKENNILFAMAERLLTPPEQIALAEEFEKLEIEEMGEGTHERLHDSMQQLIGEIFTGSAAAH